MTLTDSIDVLIVVIIHVVFLFDVLLLIVDTFVATVFVEIRVIEELLNFFLPELHLRPDQTERTLNFLRKQKLAWIEVSLSLIRSRPVSKLTLCGTFMAAPCFTQHTLDMKFKPADVIVSYCQTYLMK